LPLRPCSDTPRPVSSSTQQRSAPCFQMCGHILMQMAPRTEAATTQFLAHEHRTPPDLLADTHTHACRGRCARTCKAQCLLSETHVHMCEQYRCCGSRLERCDMHPYVPHMGDDVALDRVPRWFRPPWCEVSFETLFAHEFNRIIMAISAQRPTENLVDLTEELEREFRHYHPEIQWRVAHRIWLSPDILTRLRIRLERVRHLTGIHHGFDYLSDDSGLSTQGTDSDFHWGHRVRAIICRTASSAHNSG